MLPINFRSFRKKLSLYRKYFRASLNKIAKKPSPVLDKIAPAIEKEVWAEVDCLSCANCCKKMTPTFTKQDIKRISAHFNETPEVFTKKWLKKDRHQDMINKTEPCQFLNLKDNKCSIYAVRPADCSGFPHLSRRKWVDNISIHKQNIDYCPATFKMVEKMIARLHELKS
jgi:uncharacterized protein